MAVLLHAGFSAESRGCSLVSVGGLFIVGVSLVLEEPHALSCLGVGLR